MQLKQLEVFVNVARLKSFSKAADALFLTQPTVSAHISALESDLGTKLVVRSTKETCLTPTGEMLYDYAAQILGLCERAVQDIKNSCSDIQGSLAIAASTVPSQYILPHFLPYLRRLYPKVFFEIYQGDSNQVVQKVYESAVELGITGSPIQKAGCVCTPFLTERMVIVTPNTPYFQILGSKISADILRTSPFLVREPGSGTRMRSEEFLRDIGVDPRDLSLVAQMQSTESILQGVKNGLGIAIVSGLAAESFCRNNELLIFDYDNPLLTRKFYLVYYKSHPLSPIAELLLEELPKFYQNKNHLISVNETLS